jgi:16S rRNA (adenine1518-N6/adenine1519-N6)-dimethyltransferase
VREKGRRGEREKGRKGFDLFIPHPSSLIPQKPLIPKKRFGQNFLVDENVIWKIVDAVLPKKDETIIEIGAGRGALTEKLLESKSKVVAIEYDRELIPFLKGRFDGKENFTLIEADALQIDFQTLIEPNRKARIVANLPYYISTAILQRIIEQRKFISDMTLMLQREVVERITAPVGDSERGFLTVLIEAYCETEKLFDVSPNCFRPVPKVWSSVARFKMHDKISVENENLFLKIVSAGFAQKRKTIFNNLRHAPKELLSLLETKGSVENVLNAAGIDSKRRAESLTLEEWIQIWSAAA